MMEQAWAPGNQVSYLFRQKFYRLSLSQQPLGPHKGNNLFRCLKSPRPGAYLPDSEAWHVKRGAR